MTNTTQRPIKIMNIIARLNVGGPAVAVTLLTEKLGPPDYNSLLVCGTIEPYEGDMIYYALEHGVQPIVITGLGRALNPVRDLKTLWRVYRLIKAEKPDIVHTHAAKAGFVGRVAAWMAGVPVILHTFHGHVFKGYFGPSQTRLFITLEKITARMSDTIITLSEGLRRELAEVYHVARKGHITVLPLGLDLEPFARSPRHVGTFRRAWKVPVGTPMIGSVGRLTPIKNHRLFLDAALIIRKQLPNVRFMIVGDGETRADTEAYVDHIGLRDCVIFTEWQKDMLPVYSDLDALVISSTNEGTPVTLIEALAAGCPVVSTSVGGVPDLLNGGKLGKLVPPDDAEALAQATLDTLATPPNMQVARDTMLDRYGIDRLIKDLDGLYRGLLAKKGRRTSRPAKP